MKRLACLVSVLAALVAGAPFLLHAPAFAQSSGNTYTNETWGYSVTWDEATWFAVTQDDTANGIDLEVSDGISYVRFWADDTIPAAPVCVSSFESNLKTDTTVTNLAPINGKDGKPIRNETGVDRSWVAFTFTVASDGQTYEIAEYLECRQLDPGKSVIVIDHITLPESYETEAPLVETLLQGLKLSTPTASTPEVGETPTAQSTEAPTVPPTTSPTTSNSEPGPVFAANGWRFNIVGGVRNAGINVVGLERKAGKDWIVVVAEVTNFTDGKRSINLRDVQLVFPNVERPIKPAPSSTDNVAKKLRIPTSGVASDQDFDPNQTRRVVLVYSVGENLTDPSLAFGDSLPISDVLSAGIDLNTLSSVRRPATLVSAAVDKIVDGNSLELFLTDEQTNATVSLFGIQSPTGDECGASEAADRLGELAGANVLLETETNDPISNGSAVYVWAEQTDGTRTLVNHQMLLDGLAQFTGATTDRFGLWLEAAEQTAKSNNVGIWKGCAGQVASPVAESTTTPTSTPTIEPTTAPTQEPTETSTPPDTSITLVPPTETPSSTTTTSGTESPTPAATAGPSVTSTPSKPSAAIFRGSPNHAGIEPGPGFGPPVKFPWTFKTGSSIFSSAAVVDGVVYIGSFDGFVYALNGANGNSKWQFKTGANVLSSPAVADGVVYVGSEDKNFYAIDKETGLELWHVETGAEVSSSPSVVDGVVYFGGMDTFVYAVDAKNGDVIWKVRVGQAFSSPAVVDGVVYIGAAQTLFALDAKSGGEIWRAQSGGPIESSPAVADGIVVVGNDSGTVLAVDQKTGQERWRFSATDTVVSSPAFVDGTVYFGSYDKNVYAIDAQTGQQKWVFETGDQVTSSPAVADGVVYIGSFDGYVYGLDAVTGEERWRFQAGPVLGSPVVVDGVVYVGGGDGTVHARRPFAILPI